MHACRSTRVALWQTILRRIIRIWVYLGLQGFTCGQSLCNFGLSLNTEVHWVWNTNHDTLFCSPMVQWTPEKPLHSPERCDQTKTHDQKMCWFRASQEKIHQSWKVTTGLFYFKFFAPPWVCWHPAENTRNRDGVEKIEKRNHKDKKNFLRWINFVTIHRNKYETKLTEKKVHKDLPDFFNSESLAQNFQGFHFWHMRYKESDKRFQCLISLF